MAELINAIILIAFTSLILISTGLIVRRFIDYRAEGIKPPLLAYRDLGLLGGLALPFLLILIVRFSGLASVVAGQIWWTLLTGIPAVLGIAQFVYFEYFIIERGESRGYMKYLLSRDAKEDRHFGNIRRDLEKEHLEEDGSSKNE